MRGIRTRKMGERKMGEGGNGRRRNKRRKTTRINGGKRESEIKRRAKEGGNK